MGNSKSAESKSPPSSSPAPKRNVDPRVARAYQRLAGGLEEELRFEHFEEKFGEALATNLWNYMGDGTVSQEKPMDVDQFGRHLISLMGFSTDIYVSILMPVHHLLKVCFEAAGIQAVEGDQKFINLLVEEMESAGKEKEHIVQWKNAVCPKLCNAVQAKVLDVFFDSPQLKSDFSSDILSPIQMFFLQSCLPPKYFPADNDNEIDEEKNANEQTRHWTPLYTSAEQGISVNRFEVNVFDYRGATVAIFKLTDGALIAIAVDQEWRHSGKRFGGPLTALYQFHPVCKRIERPGAVYCNLKLRSASMGISFDKLVSIDKEMNCVAAVEVWGCSGATTLQDQQKLKQWQSRQVERNKKVPLPGNWDENPDKTLLELAGFTFSSEKRDGGPRD